MGQIEACRRGAPAHLHRDHGHRRRRRGGHRAPRTPFLKKRTEGTERADKAAPEAGRREVLRRRCRPGRSPPRAEPTSTSSSSPPSTATSTPATAEMIPFERQFQTLHSRPELLPDQRAAGAGLADAARRHRRAARRARRLRASASARAPTSSSGPPPRRCSWMRWIGCSGRAMQPFQLRPADTPRRGRGPARRARRRRATPGGRHRPGHPAARRGDPAAGVVVDLKRIAELTPGDPRRRRRSCVIGATHRR